MRLHKLKLGPTALTLAAALLTTTPTLAAEFYLRAGTTTVHMADPDGGAPLPVTMWGYASCTGAGAGCGDVSVPGPALNVPAGDTTLTVHLLNMLPQATSLVVNGLIKPMTPVWDTGAVGSRPTLTARVRSFDAEAPPNGTADYTWTNVKPGTYLYQSGTQPQVQVQMGLYGAVRKSFVDATSAPTQGQAYSGVFYDNQATLLYSEIDPALHAAVNGGTYGACPSSAPDCGNVTSTFSYAPKYFLINGQPYPNNAVVVPTGNPGRTLLRLLNAGLTTHVPMILDAYWTVVAEDGKPYSYPARQYTALLPAAKTLDVLLTPDIGGVTYPIVDRRLNLSNNGLSDGGMMAFVQYSSAGGATGTGGNTAPVAVNDSYASVLGVQLSVGARGVLENDSDVDGLPQPIRAVSASGATTGSGTYTLNSNGSFLYTPPAGFSGVDTFTYAATDGNALSNVATVSIDVALPTAPSLPVLDAFDRPNSTGLGASWSQVASTGSSFDVQLVGNAANAASTGLGGLAIWTAGLGARQGASLTLGSPPTLSALVLKATGGTAAAAPANYVRVRYEINNGVGEVVVATMMGGSNVMVFVRQKGFPATLGSGTVLTATVDAKGLVAVFQGSTFLGGVQLPDVAAWKGAGNIGIQLQTQGASVDNFRGGNL